MAENSRPDLRLKVALHQIASRRIGESTSRLFWGGRKMEGPQWRPRSGSAVVSQGSPGLGRAVESHSSRPNATTGGPQAIASIIIRPNGSGQLIGKAARRHVPGKFRESGDDPATTVVLVLGDLLAYLRIRRRPATTWHGAHAGDHAAPPPAVAPPPVAPRPKIVK